MKLLLIVILFLSIINLSQGKKLHKKNKETGKILFTLKNLKVKLETHFEEDKAESIQENVIFSVYEKGIEFSLPNDQNKFKFRFKELNYCSHSKEGPKFSISSGNEREFYIFAILNLTNKELKTVKKQLVDVKDNCEDYDINEANGKHKNIILNGLNSLWKTFQAKK